MSENIFENRKRIKEISDECPRDNEGLPIFKGDHTTLWTIAKRFEGEILIDGETYYLRMTQAKWMVKDVDRRRLSEKTTETFNRLHKQFCDAFLSERILRSGMSKKTRKRLNREYYKENSTEIMIKRKENQKALLAQNELQVNEIYDLIIQGKSKPEINKLLVDKYQLTERRVNQLIAHAHNKVKDFALEERKILKEKHLAQLQQLYTMNIQRNDLREARSILETINKMYALNDPVVSKVEVNQKVIRFNFDMTPIDDKKDKNILNVDFEDANNYMINDEPGPGDESEVKPNNNNSNSTSANEENEL